MARVAVRSSPEVRAEDRCFLILEHNNWLALENLAIEYVAEQIPATYQTSAIRVVNILGTSSTYFGADVLNPTGWRANESPSTGGYYSPYESPSSLELPQQLANRLDHLAQLPANWDSYGAVPIDSKTITRAKAVLRQIFKIAPRGLPLPFIAPAGDGTIVLEWQTETGKELILDVPPDNSPLSFLLVEPSGIDGKGETEGVIGETRTLDEVIRRLLER